MRPRPRCKLLTSFPSRGTAHRRLSTSRHYSSSSSSSSSSPTTPHELSSIPPAPPPRWLDDVRARLGHCLMFGCTAHQVERAANLLGSISGTWRSLLAGSEGFLTGPWSGRRVEWGEMDSFGHVNNVQYFRYAEAARVNWIGRLGRGSRLVDSLPRARPGGDRRWAELMTPRGTGLIMRALKAEYKMPLVYPDTISVYHKLRSRPPSASANDEAHATSFILDCVILSHRHQRVAARLEEDIVVYDYKAQKKAALPGFAIDTFQDIYDLQQDKMVRSREKIRRLLDEVTRLEKETWDREDAVEDMGSAKSTG